LQDVRGKKRRKASLIHILRAFGNPGVAAGVASFKKPMGYLLGFYNFRPVYADHRGIKFSAL
jgi:hypothetical protein